MGRWPLQGTWLQEQSRFVGVYDILDRQRIIEAAGIRINEFITFNKDGSWRREEKEMRLSA
jgi:hypothetical protein